LNFQDIVYIVSSTMAGATLQGIAGLGLSLFASPILMTIEPLMIPGPIMAGALLLTILIVLRDRVRIDLRGVGWMAIGMLPGSALASRLLPIISLKTLSLVLGGLVLAGVIVSLSGLHFPSKWWVLFAAGFLSGLGGTLVSIGGPPVALVNQEMEPRQLRATLSGYFALSASTTLVAVATVGRFQMTEVKLTFWLLPGVIFGFLVSIPLARYLNKEISRYAVLGLSTISAVLLIVKVL
jgi:uncharacterized membrane protein YfcA